MFARFLLWLNSEESSPRRELDCDEGNRDSDSEPDYETDYETDYDYKPDYDYEPEYEPECEPDDEPDRWTWSTDDDERYKPNEPFVHSFWTDDDDDDDDEDEYRRRWTHDKRRKQRDHKHYGKQAKKSREES
eukprot:Selendium_serpulae@DN4959_c0_g1_i1.p1